MPRFVLLVSPFEDGSAKEGRRVFEAEDFHTAALMAHDWQKYHGLTDGTVGITTIEEGPNYCKGWEPKDLYD